MEGFLWTNLWTFLLCPLVAIPLAAAETYVFAVAGVGADILWNHFYSLDDFLPPTRTQVLAFLQNQRRVDFVRLPCGHLTRPDILSQYVQRYHQCPWCSKILYIQPLAIYAEKTMGCCNIL
jgi:hypothetical protein